MINTIRPQAERLTDAQIDAVYRYFESQSEEFDDFPVDVHIRPAGVRLGASFTETMGRRAWSWKKATSVDDTKSVDALIA